jgi:hypothetical protein
MLVGFINFVSFLTLVGICHETVTVTRIITILPVQNGENSLETHSNYTKNLPFLIKFSSGGLSSTHTHTENNDDGMA